MTDQDLSYEALLDNLNDGVYFVTLQRTIMYWNRGAERITGYTRSEILGRENAYQMLGHVTAEGNAIFNGVNPIEHCIKEGESFEKELYIVQKDGARIPVLSRISPIFNSRGETIGAMEIFSDISGRINAQQRIAELEEMALICPTTEVGNRRYTQLTLQNAYEELQRYNWIFGILFADVDHFKVVNDTHGHKVGDEVLRMVAHALRSCLRAFDFVGRWGGEEFIIILPNITDDILHSVAERCRQMVEASIYQSEGKVIQVTVSIGGAIASPNFSLDECLALADSLMYRSKTEGRNRVTIE
ncbi:MAG: sensor domain-containing diguanylate cyclase [Candidatus Hydrogenedentes bacterium]|nr:sensor domain-containing diguanylate cyclase [Candidatus Hydrogenedentota bacterium]